jgi:hypothetical protein
MPKLEKIGENRSAPSKILHMSFPDDETLAFWRMTAHDLNEYAARIARFSRTVGEGSMRNAVQSSGHRWRDAANAVLARRPLGKVLVMPVHADHSSESSQKVGHLRSAAAFLNSSSWRIPIGCDDSKTRKVTQGRNTKEPRWKKRVAPR